MSEPVREVNDDNFEPVVLQAEKAVLVDFWSEWCGSCRILAPMLETVAEQHSTTLRVVKLNVDDNPAMTDHYNIQEIPTLILFQDGKEKERINGAGSEEAISRMIKQHIGVFTG